MFRDLQWGLVVLVAVLVALHFVLRIGYGLGELAPDLLLLSLLVTARFVKPGTAAGIGLFLGFLEGAMLPMTMGVSAVALVILGYVGGRTRKWFSDDNVVFLALYFFLGKWVYDGILFLFAGARPGMAADLLVISPLASIYAAIAGLLALFVYRKLS